MGKTKSKKRKILLALAALLLAVLSIAAWQVYPFLPVGSAYKAKIVCSAVFLSGRDEASVLNEDVHADSGLLRVLDFFDVEVDHENKSVTSSFYGLVSRTAVFREGIGATLTHEVPSDDLRAEKRPVAAPAPLSPDLPWPDGERVDPAGIAAVDAEVASAFEEPNPDSLLRTRAVVVVHNGRIIAEQYAPGISRDTPLLGWSMAKSITNALAGILEQKKEITRDSNDLLTLWRQANDPRSKITLKQLLNMSSGLEFREVYSGINDVTKMLFQRSDASGFAAAKPLLHQPGTKYEYSSGTSNIICRVIRETIDDDKLYHAFPYVELFHPIGATSAVIERDAEGTFIGSSFMYATARDWARIGLLYASDGVWNGRRILPEGWVDYSRTPAPADTEKKHGAHFWLRFLDKADLPKGTFHMSGHEGQFVTIIPEEKLVVVRLGLTLKSGAWKQEDFVGRIREALGK